MVKYQVRNNSGKREEIKNSVSEKSVLEYRD